jgi:6-phosphogluconolactonase
MQRTIFSSREAFVAGAADAIMQLIGLSLSERGSCSLILSGGSTPSDVYRKLGELLSAARVDPNELFFFLGDERHVPAGDPARNATMVEESLFRNFPPVRTNVYSWGTPPATPAECAAGYDNLLKDFFTDRQRLPDVILLGLGADGHTASLFPGGETVDERGRHHPLTPGESRAALAVWVPLKNFWRLSLSARFLSSGRAIIFLAGGPGKEEAIGRLLTGDTTIPAGWIGQGPHPALSIMYYTP